MSGGGSAQDEAEVSVGRHYVLVVLIQALELAALAWLAAAFS